MGAVLGMLGSEAPAASRLSLLEALPAAGAAARQRIARSREVCGLLAAWAASWADAVDGDEAALEALLKVGHRVLLHHTVDQREVLRSNLLAFVDCCRLLHEHPVTSAP